MSKSLTIFLILLSTTLNAGVEMLRSTVSSGGSRSSSTHFVLEDGVGQLVTEESQSTGFVEQSGFYSWFLYVMREVGVEELGKERVPIFRLAPLMPNPATRDVRIQYAVAARVRVRIAVYDALGRRIRVLVNKVQDPGRYEIGWQARDHRDQRLPQGMYFIRMESKNYVKTRKLILMQNP